MPTSLSAQVLIAGAGPAGLTLALGLARRGVDVLIVDRAEAPRAIPRAAVVWPREAELLALLGLEADLRQRAIPMAATRVYIGARNLGALRFGNNDSAFPRPLVIEQHVLQGLIEAAFEKAGGRVLWRSSLTGFELDADGVRATLSIPGAADVEARAGWLVGCDGARSMVRKGLGIAFEGAAAADLEVVQVKADLDWPYDPAEGALFLRAGHAMGSFAMPGGGRRFYCFKTTAAPCCDVPPSLSEMESLIGAMMGRAPVALREVCWLSRARFQRRVAARMRQGRALLAGDAAHVWPAVGGHGMAMAVQDACNLSWRLAAVISGTGPDALLDVYSAEQRPLAAALIARMDLDLLERPLPAALVGVLGLVLPGLLASRSVNAAIESMLSDLTLGARSSPMSSSRAGGRPRAGERIPNARVRAAGMETPLHALIAGGGWSLIARPGVDRAALSQALNGAAVRVLEIEPADAAARRALGGAMLLIRPDGLIGLRARPGNVAALASYARAWLAPAG